MGLLSRYGGSFEEIRWPRGDMMALLRRCGGSFEEIRWLRGDVVDLLSRCGGSFEEIWWLIGVAHQTFELEVPGSNPASPTMILKRCGIIVY